MGTRFEPTDDRSPLKVMVLAGGPDRERAVSLRSGAQVSAALRAAGHAVEQHDVNESDLAALERFGAWGGDVVFPVLHGPWGEGGGLQRLLDERGLVYVGTRGPAARVCMDKAATKATLEAAGLPTPAHQVCAPGEPITLEPPVVIKPTGEGSSIGMAICHDAEALRSARRSLEAEYASLLVERYVAGREVTVGVLERAAGEPVALPPIEIVPQSEFYDYHAKYDSDETHYRFEIDLPRATLERLGEMALATHRAVGARHLSRVDFLVDDAARPWILEINTLPGFTTHSLLPMAADRYGLTLPALTDHLVRLARVAGGESREARDTSSRSIRPDRP